MSSANFNRDALYRSLSRAVDVMQEIERHPNYPGMLRTGLDLMTGDRKEPNNPALLIGFELVMGVNRTIGQAMDMMDFLLLAGVEVQMPWGEAMALSKVAAGKVQCGGLTDSPPTWRPVADVRKYLGAS